LLGVAWRVSLRGVGTRKKRPSNQLPHRADGVRKKRWSRRKGLQNRNLIARCSPKPNGVEASGRQSKKKNAMGASQKMANTTNRKKRTTASGEDAEKKKAAARLGDAVGEGKTE